ncbi:MAG TPA: PAS domain-containing protein [Devosia sp.]|uniref:PAS domain-containing protein n=1 Tax=Devosia sp. TaxID=1871048 RepID=UPI002F93C996
MPSHAVSSHDLFRGASEMARRMREHDWSQSPLGEPGTWPPALRTTVGLLLQSKFPMFAAWGPELGFLYNDAYAEILGAKHPAALGRRFIDIWSEIWTDILPLIEAALGGEATYQQDLPLVMNRRGYDEQTWFTFSYSPVLDDAGAIGGMFCAVTETTQQVIGKRRDAFRLTLERKLRGESDPVQVMTTAAEALGRELGIARVGYGEIDPAEEYVTVERDWTDGRVGSVAGRHRMNNFGPEIIAELRAGRMMWVDDVDHDPRVGPSRSAFAAINTRSVLAVPLFKDGRFAAMLFLHHPEPHHWTESDTALAREVVEQTWQAVERATAEAKLRQLNETLEQRVDAALAERKVLADILDGTDIFVQVVDREFTWVAINAAAATEFAQLFGVAKPRAGDNMLAALAQRPGDRENLQAIWSRALAGEQFVLVETFGEQSPDQRSYEMQFFPLRGAAGEVVGAYQFVRDVTQRLREQHRLLEAERARRDADALYRAYFENAPEALFVMGISEDGGFVAEEVNPAHEAGVGFKIEDIRGKRIEDFLPPSAAEKIAETYRQVVATGTVHQYREVYDLPSGSQYWDSSIVPVRDAEGRVTRLIGSSRNVTSQVVAEETLRQHQKMEAMGQLTGGVAHDFNNLLTPILGTLDRLQRKGTGDEREQKLIGNALLSADRAKTLVQRLLAFARRQPLQPTAVDIPTLIEGMVDLLTSTMGPQIQLVVNASRGLPQAKADANQLEMALLNLVVNARDAMPEGGTVRITASAETVGFGARSSLKAGKYIRLSVADTGMGMDAQTLARAVEPFFSTKGIGRGTGLGLSMVHGLASQLGGALTIHSRPGIGTNVELWLPQDGSLPQAVEKAEVQGEALSGAQGLALLVDDEDMVRMSTADMLAELGFRVVEARSANEAMSLINDGLKPDLVVTDHLMPGMTGTQLARHLLEQVSQLKVLVISGYAELEGIDPDLPKLNKPFTRQELAAQVGSVMRGSTQ